MSSPSIVSPFSTLLASISFNTTILALILAPMAVATAFLCSGFLAGYVGPPRVYSGKPRFLEKL